MEARKEKRVEERRVKYYRDKEEAEQKRKDEEAKRSKIYKYCNEDTTKEL